MNIDSVFIYPIYDLQSYSKYKLETLNKILDNLHLCNTEHIYIVNNLDKNVEYSYEKIADKLSKYEVIVITDGPIPNYMSIFNPKVLDIKNVEKQYDKYISENKDISCTTDDSDLLNELFNIDTTFSLDDIIKDSEETENNIDLDEMLDSVTINSTDNEGGYIPINTDTSNVTSNVLPGDNTSPSNATAILLAMINGRKEAEKSTKSRKSKKPLKLMTYPEFLEAEIKKYTIDIKMSINANQQAPCLTFLKNYIPKNSLKLSIDSNSCSLKLNNNKIKSSYINMKGVF